MDFQFALTEIKAGAKVHRAGWNGAEQYVFLVKPPQSAAPNEPKYDVSLDDSYELPNETLQPFLMVRNAQGCLVPWVPSQGDVLADDWFSL